MKEGAWGGGGGKVFASGVTKLFTMGPQKVKLRISTSDLTSKQTKHVLSKGGGAGETLSWEGCPSPTVGEFLTIFLYNYS